MNEAESTAINALLGMIQSKQADGCTGVSTTATAGNETESSLKRSRISSEPETLPTSVGGGGGGDTKKEASNRPTKRANRKHESPDLPFATSAHLSELAVRPRVVQVCVVPKTQVDHTYWDMSHVCVQDGYGAPSRLEEMTFAEKLHQMLDREDLSDYITWLPHGRAIGISQSKRLEGNRNKLLHEYTGTSRHADFVKQLMKQGFKMLTRNKDKIVFYNQFFLRGLIHLCKFMVKCKGGHKLTPDPDNEPDLDVISQQWPVLPAAAAPTEQSVAAPKSNDDSTNLAESKRPASASVDDDPTTVVVTEDPSGSVLIDLTMSPVSVIPQANTVSDQKTAGASSDVTKLPENIVSPTPRDQPKNELTVSVASTSNNRLVMPQALAVEVMAPLIPALPNRPSGTEPLQQFQPQFSTLATNGDAQAVLSTLLAQHQHQQQVHATQSMAASSQSQSQATEALLATLLRAQLQQQPQPNKPQPQPSQQEIAMAMLSAEIQRVQAQEQANTFMASLFQNSLTTPASSPPQQHAMSHFVQYQQSPTPSNHIQTAGAPSSETEGSAALASALMTSLLQSSHMAHGHHSFS